MTFLILIPVCNWSDILVVTWSEPYWNSLSLFTYATGYATLNPRTGSFVIVLLAAASKAHLQLNSTRTFFSVGRRTVNISWSTEAVHLRRVEVYPDIWYHVAQRSIPSGMWNFLNSFYSDSSMESSWLSARNKRSSGWDITIWKIWLKYIIISNP